MLQAVDLSTELGEGFILPPFGVGLEVIQSLVLPETDERFHYRHYAERYDDEVMPFVSSVSLSCGLHSGDPVVLRRVIPTLVERGIRLGAHPSYPDVFRFGQQRVEMSADDLEAVILYQFGALDGVLRAFDQRIQHIKIHGILNRDVCYDERCCASMVLAIKKFDPEMILVMLMKSPGVDYARSQGVRVVEEGFIERGYDCTGRLLARDRPKAMIEDPVEAAEHLVRMARDGKVVTPDGDEVDIHAVTFCLHIDSPGAGAMAAAAAAALEREGIQVRPLAEVMSS